MGEWLVEHGIGETRAALVDDGRILEARIEPDGILPAGTVVEARLTDVGSAGRNARAALASGQSVLLPIAPAGVTQGARIKVEISREVLGGVEPWKSGIGRASTEPAAPALPLEQRLDGAVRTLAFPSAGPDLLEDAGWSDLLAEAHSGIVPFAGGELRVFLTPAMTLIDVDGTLPVEQLAVRGAAAAALAARRLGIGGSIGVDLPTVAGKAPRQAAAAAIDAHLPPPFERTAVNGFGFVQIVRPRARASLLELAADPEFAGRALLRRAARSTGAVRLATHPAVGEALAARPEWLAALARQVGGQVDLRAEPGMAIESGYAEPA